MTNFKATRPQSTTGRIETCLEENEIGMIQSIRGFRDILPGETERWRTIEKTASELLEFFGFREIRIPVLEKTELFCRSIGETTDIVEKEMYTFPDRKGDMLTLRPEATASVVRAYIQHQLFAATPVQKLYTIGPMFRRERPQKGRYRQFYQINAEVFGIASPLVDAQILFMLTSLLDRLGILDCTVHLNSLGCPACRAGFKDSLKTMLHDRLDRLCEDCRKRADRNPLRVLDCKVPGCREALQDSPSMIDHLCDDCREHFDAVRRHLEALSVSYTLDHRLVRGLDYYTRTTFEIQTAHLGAQSAVIGGGRYDGLVKALGGPEIPGIGFAIGLDRLVEIHALVQEVRQAHPRVFFCALGEDAQRMASEWICRLAVEGIEASMDYSGRSLKSQMKQADRSEAPMVVMLGDNELAEGQAVIRDMSDKTQRKVPMEGLLDLIRSAA